MYSSESSPGRGRVNPSGTPEREVLRELLVQVPEPDDQAQQAVDDIFPDIDGDRLGVIEERMRTEDAVLGPLVPFPDEYADDQGDAQYRQQPATGCGESERRDDERLPPGPHEYSAEMEESIILVFR